MQSILRTSPKNKNFKVNTNQISLETLIFLIECILLVSCDEALDVISGFHRDADEICSLLGHYAVWSGNPIPTFRDNVSVAYSRVKKPKKKMTFLTF
jgi:hypothetical protein